jgi:8-oxo-dGTP diphosphatase
MSESFPTTAASNADPEPRIPYKIAVLVYVFNEAGELLLLHRKKAPNKDLYSPIGGKLEQQIGESPHACALREIEEEIGTRLTLDDIRLLGIVSERAYNSPPAAPELTSTGTSTDRKTHALEGSHAAHWLMFCYEVTRPLDIPARDIDEGRLEWVDPSRLSELNIPRTDRKVIWPLVERHSRRRQPSDLKDPCDSVFCVHIDCTDAENFVVTYEHPRRPPV